MARRKVEVFPFWSKLKRTTTPNQNFYLRYMDYRQYIEISLDKRFGRPCIIGTRISVYDILNWLANGMSKADLLEDFPELNEEQINACLAYAADREHRVGVAS